MIKKTKGVKAKRSMLEERNDLKSENKKCETLI